MTKNERFEVQFLDQKVALINKLTATLNGKEVVCYKAVLHAGYGLQEDCVVFRNEDGSWYKGFVPLPSYNCSEYKQELLRKKN
jgi:hypothetical protein